jgi:probable transposase
MTRKGVGATEKSITMQLVAQHILRKGDPRFAAVDQAAFAAKNLYNAALYLVRQSFIFADTHLNYYRLHARMKDTEAYKALPRSEHYVVEVVYERDLERAAVDPALAAGVDIGLNYLAAITSTKPGFVPVLVNGRPLKAINQAYNKRIAELQTKLGKTGRTALMKRLTTQII